MVMETKYIPKFSASLQSAFCQTPAVMFLCYITIFVSSCYSSCYSFVSSSVIVLDNILNIVVTRGHFRVPDNF